MVTYGYARVSSADQNEARQIVALTDAGIRRGNIFVDHRSGKDFNRPAWRRMRRTVREGVFVGTRPARRGETRRAFYHY